MNIPGCNWLRCSDMVMASGFEKLMILKCCYQPKLLEAQCQALLLYKTHSCLGGQGGLVCNVGLAISLPFHSWGKGGRAWPHARVCNALSRLQYLLGGPASFVTYLSPNPDHSWTQIGECSQGLCGGAGRLVEASGLICSSSLQLLSANSFVCIWGRKKKISHYCLSFISWNLTWKLSLFWLVASKGINHLSNKDSNNSPWYGFQTVWLLSLGVHSIRIECALNLGWA